MPLGHGLAKQQLTAPLIDREPGRDRQQGQDCDGDQEAAGAHWRRRLGEDERPGNRVAPSRGDPGEEMIAQLGVEVCDSSVTQGA